MMIKILLIISLFTIINCHGVLQVLLLGGNGFIGSHLTTTLLNNQKRLLNITILSRGNWPYDTDKTIEPFVHHISCDRYQGLKYCSDFMNMVNHVVFDNVVDFSAYEPQVIEDTLKILKKRAGTYIYISSDSVYEVCEKSTGEKLKEEDSIRPKDEELKAELAAKDSYGDEKLRGEEVLKSQKIVPYIILRLPDVMGERDSTKRWWFYVLWLQYYKIINKPLEIPKHLETLKTSFVYASDVANIISNIVLGYYTPEIENGIFNLGFENGVTLKELLIDMADILEVKDIEFTVKDKNAVYMFPSVTRGQVDITKAKKLLNFKPTDWNKALKNTIYFYKKAFNKFPKERDLIIGKLKKLIVPEQILDEFIKTLFDKGNGREEL